MKKSLFHNFGYKLLAVVFAILLWLVVVNITDYTITVNHVCAASVTITKGEEANGTFTLSATEVCGDGDGATVEVTDIEPAEGYRFKEITTSASGVVDNDLKKVTGIK